MTTAATGPSARIDADTWTRAGDDLVETLRTLIRIPSVNPPAREAPDQELAAAEAIGSMLRDAGLDPEILQPEPGRGSVHARLRGDGTGGDPFLLLSHLDVVPAPPDGWTHDPFAADLDDGYIYGRGAVDMKDMVALELGVVRMLAAETRAAGRDPARDPVPGLRRDVLFTCTADEEAGGSAGVRWLVENRPEWLRAAGGVNECGGVATTIGGRRFYPIGVAEKGLAAYRITVRGTWGHGSMPRPDNAAVRAAEIVTRLASPGPIRLTPVMRRTLEVAGATLGPGAARILDVVVDDDRDRADEAAAAACDPMIARAVRALIRDTLSPNVVSAGIKYNVIPGEAVVEVDCRALPGTTEEDVRDLIRDRLGPDLAAVSSIELLVWGPPAESPAEGPLYDLLVATLAEHDPDGVALPVMAPFATDSKYTIAMGIPTYGFSPLRLDAGERFLERFHGVDERVSVDALRWGLPVLYDVVRRFCA